MTDEEKKAFLKKMDKVGKSYDDFNRLNKSYWTGRLILGFIIAVILILIIYNYR